MAFVARWVGLGLGSGGMHVFGVVFPFSCIDGDDWKLCYGFIKMKMISSQFFSRFRLRK